MVLVTPHALADTFQTVNERTPWSRVQEYRRVQEYASHHPNKGSQAISTALNLNRNRIRVWLEGNGKPDPVHAIDDAREHGWIDVSPDSDQGQAWVRLVAWIYSGGSIDATNYQPIFFVRERDPGLDRTELDVLRGALNEIGARHQLVSRDNSRRATHVIPAESRTLVGRCLAAAGAPVGEKNAETDIKLPEWLFESSLETRRTFARIYVLNRGTPSEHEPKVTIREERPQHYHDQFAQFLREASNIPEGVRQSDHNITLRSEVVDALLTDSSSNQ